MNTPESLSGIVPELIRRGLPTDYARRAANELADHHRDLVDELQASGLSESAAETDASLRLGNSRTLVKKTVREYQRRYWCGRWPLVTFLLGPIPFLLLIWVATWLVLLIIGWPLLKSGVVDVHSPDGIISFGEHLMNHLAVAWFGFAAPAITAVMLAKWSKQAALSSMWIVVSACVLGFATGMVSFTFPYPELHHTFADGRPVPADQMMLIFGIPMFAPSWMAAFRWYSRDLLQICQVLLPMAVAAAVTLRARQLSLCAYQAAAGDC